MNIRLINQTILLSLFLVLSAVGSANAASPNALGAKLFAENFFKTKSPQFAPGKVIKPPVLKQCYQSASLKQTPVFVFQHEKSGFVVLGQSTKGFQILGYSDKANFNPTEIPESLQQLLRLYENANPDSIVGIQSTKGTNVVVGPLLDEAGVGLNQFHHENVGDSWTGCVATAMTQIMCYYRYPDKGIGSHCYNNSVFGQLCADFGNTHYNWINPTDDDYKLLSYHVGVSMDMNYNSSPNGSSPSSPTYPNALQEYFGYTCEPFNEFSRSSPVIQNVIAQRKPIYVELPGNPGHAVVLDGYDSNGFFHVNFGWGGGSNGYYLLNSNSLIYMNPYKFGTNLVNALLIQPGHVPLNKTDSLALVSISKSISNLEWDLSDSRKRTGITTLNGRVMGLQINSYNTNTNEGSIPEDIGNLSELINLSITGKLHGTIPNSVTKLTKLQSLRITNGSGTLSDTIPTEIGNLINLTDLSIFNAAKGPIPKSIGKLTNLAYLWLSTGNIDGAIPEEFYSLKNLQTITFNDQKLSGTISEKIGNLKNVSYLDITNNNLSGKIPTTIGELNNLLYLDLSGNKLSGEIPQSLNNCTSISAFKLNNNELEGEVPAIFDNKQKLTRLDLSNNKLTAISENIGKLTNLETLNLDNNRLTSLPNSLNKLRALQSLSANSNKINRLSESMNQLTSLNTLNLAYNELTTFHPDICLLPNLASINLSNNKITRLPGLIAEINAPILQIENNELSGPIPAGLLRTEPGYYRFQNNRFVYNDLPWGTDFTNRIGTQKPLKLLKNTFKGNLGDSIEIDIRKICSNLNKHDTYVWCEHPKEKKELQPAIKIEDGPVLHLKLSDKNIGKTYYCLITNDSAATYKDPQIYYRIPCLENLITDTVYLAIQTEEEFFAEKYPEQYIVKSESLQKKELSDKSVTLISPFKMRGVKKWEGSSDGKTWYELSTTMTQNDLKTNLISVKEEELKISPKTPAYYRCALLETNCEPAYSDTMKINPYGKVVCDTTLNVRNKTVTIKKDSIEVTIPQGINDGDFRLTIIKLDNPPTKPDSVFRLSSVYDVTVSFGDTFYLPVVVKLKNLNKMTFNQMNIENYKAVYFNDIKQRWEYYNDASINLNDTTLTFGTYHFTKIGYFEFNEMNYTHRLTKKRVNVIYNVSDINFFELYDKMVVSEGLKSWHNTNTNPDKDGNPYMIQDIAEYMDQIIEKCDSLGLETPGLRFNVYVKQVGNYAQIGATSYLSGRGFLYIDPIFMSMENTYKENRTQLMTTLAHEYSHYTQDYYMSMIINNYFWQEAAAPLGGRMIWNTNDLPLSEPEMLINQGLSPSKGNKTIFEILASSWFNDYNLPVVSKLASNSADYNLASLFFHYMQNYRHGTTLDAAVLLKETSYFDTWLGYLESYIKKYLKSTTGTEFADYVKYIFSGVNPNFTVINQEDGNPYKYIYQNIDNKGVFADLLNYKFVKHDYQTNKISIKIPYLGARMYLLNNMTQDKAVVVKYKRLTEKNENEKTYYGKYDEKTKQMKIVEITDSTEYVFLLEALSEKSNIDFLNTGFLLFVNSKTNSTIFTDYNASFELTATPIPNLTDLCYADVTQEAIHNFSNGNKNLFYISGKVSYNIPDINFSTEDYQTSMELIEDSVIQVNCSFTNKIRVYNGPGLPATIQDTHITQRIEYDFITGKTIIHQFTKTVNKWGAYYDDWTKTDKPEYTFEVVEQDQKMWLKKILNLIPDTKSWGESTLLFETKNTEETRNTVEKLEETKKTTQYDASGAETGTSTVNYINTDYTSNNTMSVWFHNK